MNEFLKGNFKVQREVSEENATVESGTEELTQRLRKRALSSIGGSMVYIERNMLSWDGESKE